MRACLCKCVRVGTHTHRGRSKSGSVWNQIAAEWNSCYNTLYFSWHSYNHIRYQLQSFIWKKIPLIYKRVWCDSYASAGCVCFLALGRLRQFSRSSETGPWFVDFPHVQANGLFLSLYFSIYLSIGTQPCAHSLSSCPWSEPQSFHNGFMRKALKTAACVAWCPV